ncbi:condensation domain-containing protein [Nannocystis pusilla]|uniref:condensation domain-containing protein n=1 Tax=Nannocystis pusilla TaxID=889268 RepID=UPI003B81CAAB
MRRRVASRCRRTTGPRWTRSRRRRGGGPAARGAGGRLRFRAGPLARVVLVRMPGGRTWMVKTTHHILADGWSMPVVLAELQAAYAAHRDGRRLALPEPVAYERYIAWLATRDHEASSAFFAEYLAGVEEPTRLPSPPPAATPQRRRRSTGSRTPR